MRFYRFTNIDFPGGLTGIPPYCAWFFLKYGEGYGWNIEYFSSDDIFPRMTTCSDYVYDTCNSLGLPLAFCCHGDKITFIGTTNLMKLIQLKTSTELEIQIKMISASAMDVSNKIKAIQLSLNIAKTITRVGNMAIGW